MKTRKLFVAGLILAGAFLVDACRDFLHRRIKKTTTLLSTITITLR